MLIGIAGSSGTGKSTIASILAEHFDAHILTTSGVLRSILTAQGVPCTRESLQNLAREYQERQGPLALLHVLLRDVRPDDGKVYVIDAIRTIPQGMWLAQQKHAFLIGIHSHLWQRLERLQQRARDAGEAALCASDLVRQDRHPMEVDVQSLLTMATHLLVNDGTLDAFKTSVILTCAELVKIRDSNAA